MLHMRIHQNGTLNYVPPTNHPAQRVCSYLPSNLLKIQDFFYDRFTSNNCSPLNRASVVNTQNIASKVPATMKLKSAGSTSYDKVIQASSEGILTVEWQSHTGGVGTVSVT